MCDGVLLPIYGNLVLAPKLAIVSPLTAWLLRRCKGELAAVRCIPAWGYVRDHSKLDLASSWALQMQQAAAPIAGQIRQAGRIGKKASQNLFIQR